MNIVGSIKIPHNSAQRSKRLVFMHIVGSIKIPLQLCTTSEHLVFILSNPWGYHYNISTFSHIILDTMSYLMYCKQCVSYFSISTNFRSSDLYNHGLVPVDGTIPSSHHYQVHTHQSHSFSVYIRGNDLYVHAMRLWYKIPSSSHRYLVRHHLSIAFDRTTCYWMYTIHHTWGWVIITS